MRKVRLAFRYRQNSIIAIQCRWRQKLAKRELRRRKQVSEFELLILKYCYTATVLYLISLLIIHLLQEANEAGALRLAKSKLEKQLEDLTWRLQFEKRLRVLLFVAVVLF